MPDIALTITDAQDLMLNWAAQARGVTRDVLIADALTSYLQPLADRFRQAHKREAADIFEFLTPEDQLLFLQQIKSRISSYPAK